MAKKASPVRTIQMGSGAFAQMRRDFGTAELGALAFVERLEYYGYRLVSVGDPYPDPDVVKARIAAGGRDGEEIPV